MAARRGPALDGYFASAPPRVLAHRGLALEAPENTLLAFAAALAAGATHLETDVQVSADGVAVVAHDPDLSRIAGRDVRVAQLTAAELQRVALGAGQGFCTLAEALDAFPEANFNIDVKAIGAAPSTVAAIRDARAEHRVLVGSFRAARRLAVVRELPGVATSLSSESAIPAVLAARAGAVPALRRILRGVQAVQFPLRMAGLDVVTARSVAAFHAAGVEVHIWTVNDVATMDRLLALGVDGIVSDRADLALERVARFVASR